MTEADLTFKGIVLMIWNSPETGAFFLGALAATLMLAADYYRLTPKFRPQITWRWFLESVIYCLFGGLASALLQYSSELDKTLKIQALAVGISWPTLVNNLRKRYEVKDFLASGDDAPVEEVNS